MMEFMGSWRGGWVREAECCSWKDKQASGQNEGGGKG